MNAEDMRRLIAIGQAPLARALVDFLRDIDSNAFKLRHKQFVVSEELWGTDEEARFVFTTDSRQFEVPFSERFNTELLRRSIRMDTTEQEALRCGTHALSNLRYVDAMFGRDMTNSVLWEVVNLRFDEVPPIKKALSEIVVAPPHEGEAANACNGYIQNALNGLGNSLVVELGYDNRGTAFAILAGAIQFVLDRRYSLSLNRIFFR